MSRAGSLPWLLPAVPALLRRPGLWPTALRQAVRLAPRGWWRRPPFVPRPDPDYLKFRLVTMYGGDGDAPLDPDDLIAWLVWCRRWPVVTT